MKKTVILCDDPLLLVRKRQSYILMKVCITIGQKKTILYSDESLYYYWSEKDNLVFWWKFVLLLVRKRQSHILMKVCITIGQKKDNLIFCMWIRGWGDSIHSCPFYIHYSTFSGDRGCFCYCFISNLHDMPTWVLTLCCRHKDIFCGCKTCWHFKYMNIFIFLFFITTIILKCFYDLWILIIYPTSALHLTSVIVGLHIISHYLLIKPLKCLHTI